MEREKLKSRLGFILLSAGCAIGIGNVWKFPYIAGQGGGPIRHWKSRARSGTFTATSPSLAAICS